ncbi:helix-turn-helix domain-containing protein [Rhizobium binae]|nr:helix-turn-helix domain-containing protein [Rhizobium binae]
MAQKSCVASNGQGPSKIARDFGISRDTVYQVRKRFPK